MSYLRSSMIAAALLIAVPALADTHISFVNDQGQASTQIYVKGGKVRMEGGGPDDRHVAIYDVASNSMSVLMPAQKKYLLFNSASAAQIGARANAAQDQMQAAQTQEQAAMAQHQGQMDQANQQMQAAMAKMSPEQQQMMQKMMAAHGGGAPGSMPPAGGGMQVEVKETGQTETVAGHSCKDLQLTVNGRPSGTMCVVSSPSSLGIDAADLKTLEQMHDGMHKIVAQMGPMGQGMATMFDHGFSIKTTRQSYENFKPVTETDTLKSVQNGSVGGSLFEIPAGYTQTTMEEMMQNGHR